MTFGVCAPAAETARAKAAGCDYIELGFSSVADWSEAEFDAAVQALTEGGLRAEAMNCFIPGRFPLLGNYDRAELNAFLCQGFRRAQAMGTQVVVFGSSGARRRPAELSKEEARTGLVPFLRLAGKMAASYGVRIAIEPLCYDECNAVNALREGLLLAEAADSSSVGVLADMYHMGENGEDFGDILLAKDRLWHCHIGRPGGRTYPLPGDGYDYAPFFTALREIGYAGRLSVEASPVHGPEDLAATLSYIRELQDTQ
ncbi:MAG: sugar phosphate isomerase/epimerase [Oscillospiraceae bacterium]|jgi:sugar phosphate isomerase/epimerase|nr:sugar phosphate isomerase/epimerase [Oscillospiraceae bacterium]